MNEERLGIIKFSKLRKRKTSQDSRATNIHSHFMFRAVQSKKGRKIVGNTMHNTVGKNPSKTAREKEEEKIEKG